MGEKNGETESYLYQGVSLNAGSYRLTFDFLGSLSDQGQIPDLFMASLFFANNPPFDPINSIGITGSAPLFDLDWAGETLYANLSNASIVPSSKGGGWRQFGGVFSVQQGYAIPTFELLNLSFLDVSSVNVTNVNIGAVAVDEPGTFWLMGMGILVAAGSRRLGSRRQPNHIRSCIL